MTALRCRSGSARATITPPTPVQLAGFIDDQPATEVHDDLEVRAVVVRERARQRCACSCATCSGMSPWLRDADP